MTNIFQDIDAGKYGGKPAKMQPPKRTLRDRYESVKAKVKENYEERKAFRSKLKEEERGAYRKEKLKQARKKGRARAQPMSFKNPTAGFRLAVGKAKEEPRQKSNMERLLGL